MPASTTAAGPTPTAASTTAADAPLPPFSTPWVIGTAALMVAAFLAGTFGRDLTVGSGGMPGMSMTHYMELLGVNQPWNLLLFMGLPVVIAETLAITELAILFRRERTPRWVRLLSGGAGLLGGPVMLGITAHLIRTAVVPLTLGGGWRGPGDVIAVTAYLLGTIPMVAITLVELRLVGRSQHDAQRWHAVWVAVFLVVAHVAMIFGMLDPAVLGYAAPRHVH